MARCRDCILWDKCKDAFYRIDPMTKEEVDTEREKQCGYFKSKADYIKIVGITKDINFAIRATNMNSDYDVGLRNGLRLALAFIDGKEPQYESCKESKHKNPNDENCVICNSELDEAGAGGIWDLAGEICSVLNLVGEHEEQDTIYNIIRNYIEQQEYCPNCGVKMKEGKAE